MGYRSTYNRRLRAMRRLKKRLAMASLLAVGACAAALLMLRDPMPIVAGPTLEADAAPLRQPGQAMAAAAAPAAHAGTRRIYPYSIVPGGVSGRSDVVHVLRVDQVVAQHYAGLQVARMSAVTVKAPRAVYVSYRKGDKVYWTAKKVLLAQGETLLSDGSSEIRTRCGNRISDLPRLPVEADGPSAQMLDTAMNIDGDDVDADGERQAGATTSSAAGDSAPASQPAYLASVAYGDPAPAYARAPALTLLGMSGMTGAIAPATWTGSLLAPALVSTQAGVAADTSVSSGTSGTPTGAGAGSDTGGVTVGSSGTGGTGGTGGTDSTSSTPSTGGTDPATGTGGSTGTPLGSDGDPPLVGGGAALAPLLPALTPPNMAPMVIVKASVDSAQVPEPDSLWLSGAALAAMLLLRRKPRRARQG